MNRERLEKLAYLMRNLKTEFPQMGGFDLNGWYLPFATDEGCGTVACACGWATQWEPFQEEGFHLSYDHVPQYRGLHNWLAVMSFFDIDRQVAYWLFDKYNYLDEDGNIFVEVLPGHVANRIEALLNGYTSLDYKFGIQ